jgi:hypothetical protein
LTELILTIKEPVGRNSESEEKLEQSFERIDFLLKEKKKRPEKVPTKGEAHILSYPKYFKNPLYKPSGHTTNSSKDTQNRSGMLPHIKINKPEEQTTIFADHRSDELRKIMSSKDFLLRSEVFPKINNGSQTSTVLSGEFVRDRTDGLSKRNESSLEKEFAGTYQDKRKVKIEMLKKVAAEHVRVHELVEKARVVKKKSKKKALEKKYQSVEDIKRSSAQSKTKDYKDSRKIFKPKGQIEKLLKQYEAIEEEGGESPSQGTIKLENSITYDRMLYSDD